MTGKVGAGSDREDVTTHSASLLTQDGVSQPQTGQSVSSVPSNELVIIRSGLGHGLTVEGLVNHFFFYTVWVARCLCVAYKGKRWHQVHYWKKTFLQRQCAALGYPAGKTYLNIIVDGVQSFVDGMEGSGLFWKDNASMQKAVSGMV